MKRSRPTRRSTRAIDINHSDIKHDTTCINIVPGGLPLTMACEICHNTLDIHTKKSGKKSKKMRHKHYTNRCKQYWMSKWSNGNIGPCMKNISTRRFLNINLDTEIEFAEVKKRNYNLISKSGFILRYFQELFMNG